MAFTRVGFDTFLNEGLPGQLDANGGAISLSRYFKGAESSGATTVVDSGPSADSQASGWVGTPTFEAAGSLYGVTNGGNAVTFNGTSQHAKLGRATGWLPSIYTTGIWFTIQVKMTDGGSFFQYRVIFDGFENAGRTQRGLFIGGRHDGTRQVIRIVFADNAGNAPVWEFHAAGMTHWTEGVWHQITVQLKLTSGAATTAAMCQFFLGPVEYVCAAHTSATVGAVSNLSTGQWMLGCFSGANTPGYPSGIGGFTWQRAAFGTGILTQRQVCDINREARYVFMGVAEPRTAVLFDNAADCGLTNPAEGDVISAVTNYGDSGAVSQSTAARKPTWTSRFGGCADFGKGLDATAEPDFKNMTFSRTAGHSYWFPDCSILAVVGSVTGGYRSQSSPSIASMWWDGSFNGLSLGLPDSTDSTAPHIRPLVVSTVIAHTSPSASHLPANLPTFSVLGVMGGMASSGGQYKYTPGSGHGYVDGQLQAHTTSYQIGAWGTAMSGSNYIGGPSSGSLWGGLAKCVVASNRMFSKTEVDDFNEAARERWGRYIQPDAETVNFLLGDSITCDEGGTEERCDGWQARSTRTRNVRWYNLSVRQMVAGGTAGQSMNTRAAVAGNWAVASGKRVNIVMLVGRNDKAGGASTATLASRWKAARDAAVTAATAAGALSVTVIGVSLRLGVDDAFTDLLGTASAPCDYVVRLPAFGLADSLHPSAAGAQEIWDAIEAAVGGVMGSVMGVGNGRPGMPSVRARGDRRGMAILAGMAG